MPTVFRRGHLVLDSGMKPLVRYDLQRCVHLIERLLNTSGATSALCWLKPDRATLQLALVQHVWGQTTAAVQQLATLLDRLQEDSTPGSLLVFPFALEWQGRLLLATGDLHAVQHSLETQTQNPLMFSFALHLATRILRVRLLLAQGQTGEALRQLENLLPVAQERRHQYTALEIQLLLALAHAASKRNQQAQHWLRQALA
jgi:hypothetical protein